MKLDLIPHAAQSLREIEVKAALLRGEAKKKFLRDTHDGWCELYSKYMAKFPLDDPSDFLLMVCGIRRLIERSTNASR